MKSGWARWFQWVLAMLAMLAGAGLVEACNLVAGVDELSANGECAEAGERSCKENTPRECGADGSWKDEADCGAKSQTCVQGECVDCAPGAKRCDGLTPEVCDASGEWMSAGPPCDESVGVHCSGGECVQECFPGDLRCFENVQQFCDAGGSWQSNGPVCDPCVGCDAVTAACSTDPNKANGVACNDNNGCTQADACQSGACTGAATCLSCNGLAATCGPADNEGCCASPVVTGGTFNRGNKPAYPATVADFRLDRFEITVGRFRKFVEGYPGNRPVAGAGAHPLIGGSGWDPAWPLAADQAALIAAVKCSATYQTWTDAAGANENLPMSCMDWFEAFAFCAWDGGRLPTEAEWNYAAAGGSEQRQYPWGAAVPSPSYAVYDCTGDGSAAESCAFTDILKVGSKSANGDGKWGQADLGGSMWEWNLDWYNNTYVLPCMNCAILTEFLTRVIRGGAWASSAVQLPSAYRFGLDPSFRSDGIGARCARTP